MSEASPLKAFERAGRFLLVEIWAVGSESASRFTRGFVAAVRVGFITIEGFFQDLCLVRASALTFASLMALVPTLALSFAVLRGLGWRGDRLEELILGKATLLSPDAISLIVSYIDNTSFAGLGAIGGSILLLTFVSVMTNIESSFNAIWDDAAPRSLIRRITDYFSVLLIAPILLAVATSLTATVRSSRGMDWVGSVYGIGAAAEYVFAYAAYGIMWLLFAFLYMAIPNTRVRAVPALVGGMIAGSIWHLTQWTYIQFQFGVGKYNAIYGAMAQLPLLMAWIYVSWVIVLFGAEISFAVQNVMTYSRERRRSHITGQALRERAGLSIGAELASAATGQRAAPSIEDLANEMDVSQSLVRDILSAYSAEGLVHLSDEVPERCYLSLSPNSIGLARVLDALRGGRADMVDLAGDEDGNAVRVFLRDTLDARDTRIGERTLADLIELQSARSPI
jgi:membrane protein